MSRLIKPTEYAKEQNISRQAVYAKIKKGLLDSKTVDGKIYVVLSDKENIPHQQPQIDASNPMPHMVDAKELLASKDETISVLKESIKNLKTTNTEINTTLRGEIELLKQVFTEMRTLYVKQVDSLNKHSLIKATPLEQQTTAKEIVASDTTETNDKEDEECWVDIETFLDRVHIKKEKKRAKVKKRLLKAYEQSDERLKVEDGVFYLSCYDFYEDIL